MACVPGWLTAGVAWVIIVIGAASIVALAIVLAYWAITYCLPKGRVVWEFLWFMGWRTHRSAEDPTLAAMLKSAEQWAEQSMRQASSAGAEEASLCWQSIMAAIDTADGEEAANALRGLLPNIVSRIREYERDLPPEKRRM